jgi:hypothetical protein
MDKSSGNNSTSKIGGRIAKSFPPSIEEFGVDSESVTPYNYSNKPQTVRIQSVFDARLEYTGQVSGKQYVWNKAGDIVEVGVEDSEILLAKRMGEKLCCGNSTETNKLFQQIAV